MKAFVLFLLFLGCSTLKKEKVTTEIIERNLYRISIEGSSWNSELDLTATLDKTCLVIAQMNQYDSHSVRSLKFDQMKQSVPMASRKNQPFPARRENPREFYENQFFSKQMNDSYNSFVEVVYPRLIAEVIFLPLK
ncbi:MAG: hypothetical protein QE271_13880 [Bacteriovoracaceae bacterium]|nr:hypothetical protein [Bacteriovoracaceae bacterium]